MYVFAALVAIFPVGVIGFFEGGFNHLLKNLLYFSSTGDDVLNRLYPPGTYEMPNSVIFEISGILQFAVAIAAAYYTFQYWRQWRRTVAAVPVHAL